MVNKERNIISSILAILRQNIDGDLVISCYKLLKHLGKQLKTQRKISHLKCCCFKCFSVLSTRRRSPSARSICSNSFCNAEMVCRFLCISKFLRGNSRLHWKPIYLLSTACELPIDICHSETATLLEQIYWRKHRTVRIRVKTCPSNYFACVSLCTDIRCTLLASGYF
jgi:hypothetical protein